MSEPASQYALVVNGEPANVTAPGEMPLALVLRNLLDLPGTRVGCNLEQCGSCRVIVNGELAASCTRTLAATDGCRVETVESHDPLFERLRAAFTRLNAGQCGYCLSGILVTAARLLRENPSPDRPAVMAALRENLCRCGAHNRIIAAIIEAGQP